MRLENKNTFQRSTISGLIGYPHPKNRRRQSFRTCSHSIILSEKLSRNSCRSISGTSPHSCGCLQPCSCREAFRWRSGAPNYPSTFLLPVRSDVFIAGSTMTGSRCIRPTSQSWCMPWVTPNLSESYSPWIRPCCGTGFVSSWFP